VVIAVIAALAGIILPSLGGARESARRTRCLVNLQQIGVGTQLYLDTESEGVLPIVRPFQGGEPGGGSDPTLLEVLESYIDCQLPRRPAPGLEFELSRDSCFRCPSDRGQDGDRPLWATAGTSYEYFPGLVMTGVELFFAVESPAIEKSVTRAMELRSEAGAPLPLLLDGSDQWHAQRASGPAQNAVYFPGMHADWARDFGEDTDDLFADIGRILGRG